MKKKKKKKGAEKTELNGIS